VNTIVTKIETATNLADTTGSSLTDSVMLSSVASEDLNSEPISTPDVEIEETEEKIDP